MTPADAAEQRDQPERDAGGRPERDADPAVPEALRRELAKELVEARRLAARPQEDDAAVALGHEGEPWWAPTPEGRRARLAAAMRALLSHRRPEATICPSDAARIVGGESWRDLMDTARDVAAELARQGVLVVRQRGVDIDMATASGPVRLARGPRWISGPPGAASRPAPDRA